MRSQKQRDGALKQSLPFEQVDPLVLTLFVDWVALRSLPLFAEKLLVELLFSDKTMYFDFSESVWALKFSEYSSYSIALSTRCFVADTICDCKLVSGREDDSRDRESRNTALTPESQTMDTGIPSRAHFSWRAVHSFFQSIHKTSISSHTPVCF